MRHTLTLAILGCLTAACDDDNLRIDISDGHVSVSNTDDRSAPMPPKALIDVTGFDALGTETFVDVVAAVGAEHEAWWECDPALAQTLEVTVDNTVLVVRNAAAPQPPRASGPCTLHVTAPSWRAIVSLGSGDVQASGPLTALEQVHTAGSGDVSISGLDAAPAVLVVATGSGDITLQGSAHTLDASTAGSGDILAGNLAVDAASATTTGSGDISVYTYKSLAATTRGSGDILTSGPGVVTGHSEGSGEVRQ